ncbi:phosphotransferase [Amycolatopsis sp. NPDC049868]|uniref:phosphotransferase n=1 Tax=Amycolatopsis sp. NPDC049868 TaxID=3363934 RepID=UPI00379CC876
MVTSTPESALRALSHAAEAVGLDAKRASLIRDGNNVMYALPGGIVARIGSPGGSRSAEREVAVSRWLNAEGVSATRTIETLPQGLCVDDRPVTWWKLLPSHRPATPAELGGLLRRLHQLAPPQHLKLPSHDPFADIGCRVRDAIWLDSDDRIWLTDHEESLRQSYAALPSPTGHDVIHGDAWQGNVAVLDDGHAVLLDLEAVSLGRHAWDLVQIAVDYTDFDRLTKDAYDGFVNAYGGFDLTHTSEFRLLADIQELRWLAFSLSKASSDARVAQECQHRLACLRGQLPRPWTWTAI